MTRSHAFLVMAHDDADMLSALLRALDHPRADIFVLIDRRAKSMPGASLADGLEHSAVRFIDRMEVRWAGYSQVLGELALLDAAGSGYDYYHLLSGHDLPVLPAQDFYRFFDDRRGMEFVEIWATSDNGMMTEGMRNRFRYYHPFELRSRDHFLGRALKRALIDAQRLLRIDRTPSYPLEISYGTNWFSITDDLRTHTLGRRALIEKMFRRTSSPDELFLQTLALNSEFESRLYQYAGDGATTPNARFIDWSRPGEHAYSPYVFREDDFDRIVASGCAFARKFDSRVDPVIIARLVEHVRR